MARYEVSDPADGDIFEIGLYVGARNIRAAEKTIREFERTFERLAEFPGIGRPRDELKPGIRSITIGKYVVLYREIDDGVRILRLFHGSRDYLEELE